MHMADGRREVILLFGSVDDRVNPSRVHG